MSKFSIELVKDYEEWNTFVETSPQGTVFSNSDYLKNVTDQLSIYWIKKGNEVKAGLCIIKDGSRCILDDLVIYNGLLFKSFTKQKEVNARLEQFQITKFVIDEFLNSFEYVRLSLSPNFEDIRPFLWFNYGDLNKEKYSIEVRYTSYLEISSFANNRANIIYEGMETNRQQNIKLAEKSGAYVLEENKVDLFLKFYKKLMERANNEVNQDKLIRMSSLIQDILKKEIG